jgi:hypothetical protein
MFTSLELALIILSVEFALLALGLTFYLRRGSNDQRAAAVDSVTTLVGTVERTEKHRRDALLTTMQEIYRMEPDEAERVVSDFIERERAFYNALIGVHLGRTGKTLADVPSEVTKLVAPWLRVTPRGQVDESEMVALQDTNSALEMELADTKKVLDSLMAEYSAAFNRQQAEEAAKKQDIGEVPHDELLSIDEWASPPTPEPPPPPKPAAAPKPVAPPPPPPPPPAADVVIDLDAPDEPAADSPMSQSDLDDLLANLDDDLFSGKPKG